MVCPDLDALPDPPLPAGLALRPIRRLAADPPGGVSLEDAVALVRLANPAVGGLADHLRSLPPAFRLLAAVDGDGVVRATSGAGAFGSAARVLLVDTHPAWRGRGIATAMTAAALHAARDAGARVACLDASDAGRSIYARLGFEVAGATTQFYRG
jgi:GNAT superfamily N-acetyltransferase